VISYVSLLPDELARAEVESVRRRLASGESGGEASGQ
jgi:hypothetical protein